MLGYEHPFVDGNGRTARAVFYWSMKHHSYWLAEYISLSKEIKAAPVRYGQAYRLTETDDGDLTYFIVNQLEMITRAIKTFQSNLAKKWKKRRKRDYS
jgi:Fic family protein